MIMYQIKCVKQIKETDNLEQLAISMVSGIRELIVVGIAW